MRRVKGCGASETLKAHLQYSTQTEANRRMRDRKRVIGGMQWSSEGNRGRKSEKTTERLGKGERRRDGVICLSFGTTPMTESFFISQYLYSVYVNPGGKTTAEECDHNLSI